jgi:hypothetical protein
MDKKNLIGAFLVAQLVKNFPAWANKFIIALKKKQLLCPS